MLVILIGCPCIGLLLWSILKGLDSHDDNKLNYEAWYELNEEELYIKFAETGADRELDFDSEREFDREYEEYLNS